MNSSTSSFRMRAAIFVGTLLVAALLLEAFCRYSGLFTHPAQNGVWRYTMLDPTNAAFGDSQIGESPKIPGFTFFGPGGLQAVEFNRIAKYVYSDKEPQRVIVELAPQWFGKYHEKREPVITENALPPVQFKVLLLSPYFYEDLKNRLLEAVAAGLAINEARAEDYSQPPNSEVYEYSQLWNQEIAARPGVFDWGEFPAEGRRVLTLARAYGQNPVPGFEQSDNARYFEDAVEFLQKRGAEICFFEPPITDDYRSYRPLIDGSNYAAFYEYAEDLVGRLQVKWVRDVASFEDREFNNQDHLHPRGVVKLWPLVAEACFGK